MELYRESNNNYLRFTALVNIIYGIKNVINILP